jgi:uncharacterized membrane protein YbhN (UPF0104 family)
MIRRRATRALRLLLPPALIGLLVWRLGSAPFERSVDVLRPGPLVAALLLGFVSTAAQAMRWRAVAAGYGQAGGLTAGHAVREYYRATFGNVALPGGLLGDAARAWRNRTAPPAAQAASPSPSASSGPAGSSLLAASSASAASSRAPSGLGASAKAVLVERVTGTALLLAAGGLLALPVDLRGAAVLLAGAVLAGAVALPGLRRMPGRGRWAVLGWSALAISGLVGLFAVAAVALGTARHPVEVVALGLVAMAGASMPFGIGGFGPREAVSAVAFGAAGLTAHDGVATAAGFGLLAIVSTLPGAVLMLTDLRTAGAGAGAAGSAVDPAGPAGPDPSGGAGVVPGGVRPVVGPVVGGVLGGVVVDVPERGEVELEADVRSEHEPTGGRA